VDVAPVDGVDAFVPPYGPRQVLDPDAPVSIGAMVGPEAFEEVRYLAHVRQLQALDRIPEVASEFAEAFGRASGGLVRPYRSTDAEIVVVAMGSVLGTLKDVVDSLRHGDDATGAPRVGALGVTTFRPFPAAAVRASLAHARQVVVVEKAFAPGTGAILGADVAAALSGIEAQVHTVVAGLGGRPIPASSLREALVSAARGGLGPLTFLDLQHDLVARELARMAGTRRSGPSAENVLRDLGVVGAGAAAGGAGRGGVSPS
jgi:pyruvate ferredoxin oxidoreductase alpha subunit